VGEGILLPLNIKQKQRRIIMTSALKRRMPPITQKEENGFIMGLIASAAQVSDADLEEINAEIALARKEKAEREKCFA
jgi:hypothetical protein